ncbi:hypothetical protein BK816_03285 [Boudabousia tangfeifanii]|uniref:Cell envelope-related transcriptional attenuator domain-containing protein n=1 Tax=Boudabousia tangfeifanii TaxID=1912795 RepID=A0A1D9MJS5_9ACTO|nr:LCP family protein [Boudabousia tangfeifanii]AOZ72433.1 hypothetical protein BK816_03285 [Boudabousia tangfeifanii]
MQYLPRSKTRRIAKHRSRRRPLFPWVRLATLVAVSGLLASGTAAAFTVNDLSIAIEKSVVETHKLVTPLPRETNEPLPPDSYDGRAINILLMGRDNVDEDGKIREGDSGEGMRADTNILMHVSADRSRVEMISIPRDTIVRIPRCPRSDGTVAPATRGMFNAAFSRGGAHGDIGSAAACTINTVQQLTGLTIDDFVVVNFAGFRGMVDALGGVEMCLDAHYADPHYTGLDVGPGCMLMDGLTAAHFARARHVTNSDGSDTSRIGRQQQLVGRLVTTALDEALWTQVSFAKEALKNANMSRRLGSVSTLMGLGNSLSGIDRHNIVFATAPWTIDPADPNRVLLTSKAELMWDALDKDEPLPDGFERKDAEGIVRDTIEFHEPSPEPSPSPDNNLAPTQE